MVDRWRPSDGDRHLGDAPQGDAGLPSACSRRVSLADNFGSTLGGRFRVRRRALCGEPQENGPSRCLGRQRHYGRRHRRPALPRHGRHEIACYHPVLPRSGNHLHFARNRVLSHCTADGVRSASGDQMVHFAEAWQRSGDGSRCLRDALHRHGGRKFHLRFASGPLARREHFSHWRLRSFHNHLDRACSRHHDILRRLNQELERRVAERTSQLDAANEELRREITERQKVEHDLRRSEDHLRLVIDTIPQQIWSGPPDGTLDFCNTQWRTYVGLSLEALQGEGWQSMLHPEDRERVLRAWRESVATGTPYEQEERHRRADGQYRWFLARGVPLREYAGRIVRWYGTNTDIEDRKRAEWALQELQSDLYHLTRVTTMGGLVAAIAHEVNQPLAAIVTNANFCLRHFANGTDHSDKMREAISEVVNDATRASAVISRIRSLLQKGAQERVELDINQIIEEVIVLLRAELTRNHLTLQTDLGLDLPRLSGDRVQLQQVVINLIMNGIDAMRNLTDRPRQLIIKSMKHADGVLVQILDSGPGVDPEEADRIFEPFFTTKSEGIGLGLSISRSIVESHGGRLWAERVSNGALFQFVLPESDGVS